MRHGSRGDSFLEGLGFLIVNVVALLAIAFFLTALFYGGWPAGMAYVMGLTAMIAFATFIGARETVWRARPAIRPATGIRRRRRYGSRGASAGSASSGAARRLP